MKGIISLLLMAFMFSSCLPKVKDASCGANETFSSTLRRCIPAITGGNSSISITSQSPGTSYTKSITDTTAVNHTITVVDPYSYGYIVKWYMSYATSTTTLVQSGTSTSYSVIPSNLPAGINILEAQVYDATGSTMINSRSWTISITAAQVPQFASRSPVSSMLSLFTTSSAQAFSVTTSQLTGSAGNVVWKLNGSTVSTTALAGTSTTSAYTFDPSTVSASTYIITAEIINGATNYDYEQWIVIVANPAVTTYVTTSPQASLVSPVKAIDQQTIASGYWTYATATPADFCINVGDVDGTAGNGIDITFSLNGAGPIATANTVNDGNPICLSTIAPAYFMTLVIPTIAENRYISATLLDVDSSTYISNPPSWLVSLYPKNSAPTITITPTTAGGSAPSTCSQSGNPTTVTGCTANQDAAYEFELTVTDNDYSPTSSYYNNFGATFYVNGTPYTGANCNHTASDGLELTQLRFNCAITLDSYNTSGPVAANQTYSITATVNDDGSVVYPGNSQTSNTATWSVTTKESQTAPVVESLYTTGAYTNESYIAYQATPTTPIDLTMVSVPEGVNVVLNIGVTDAERDNYIRSVELIQDDSSCTSPTSSSFTLSPSTLLVRTSNSATHRSTVSFVMPEYAVKCATTGTIQIKVTVTDQPDNLTAATTDDPITDVVYFSIPVQNVNPVPQFDNSNTDASPGLASTINVLTGFPVTIFPGAISDASTADGNVIQYQWQVSTDGAVSWTDIDGATTANLVWTPGPQSTLLTGQATQFRLCLGDDGTGNSVYTYTNCSSPWTAVTGFSNLIVAIGVTELNEVTPEKSLGEVATYFDETNYAIYTAYASGTASPYYITLEKVLVNSDGSLDQSSYVTIKFKTLDTINYTTFPAARDLSITGNGSELFISYVVTDPNTATPRLQVRRILMSALKSSSYPTDQIFGYKYDGIGIGSSSGSDSISATGTYPMTVTFGVFNSTITFTNLASSAVDMTVICPTCSSTTQAATALANYINTQMDPVLQGVGASASGSVVTISGEPYGDFYNKNGSVLKAGKIFISGGRWHVPFLNSSLTPPNQNKVSILSGATGQILSSVAANINANNDLTADTYASTDLSNDLDYAGNLVIATKKYSGAITMHKFTLSGTSWVSAGMPTPATDVFSGVTVNNFKVAAAKSTNTNNYIIAQKSNTTSDFIFARVATGAASYATSMFTQNPLDTSTVVGQIKYASEFDITAGNNSNEVLIGLVTSSSNTTYPNMAFAIKVKGTTPAVDCTNSCPQVNFLDPLETTLDYKVSLTPVAQDIAIGTDGYVTGEATKDIMIMGYHVDTSAIPGTDIETAIINVEDESIKSTTQAPAASNISSFFNPPFFRP